MPKLQKNFKNVFERKDISGLSVFGRGHHFDWKVLLTLFFLVTFGVVLFSTNVFLNVRSGDVSDTQSSPSVQTTLINKNGLKDVIDSFAARVQTLKTLQTGKSALVDPSR